MVRSRVRHRTGERFYRLYGVISVKTLILIYVGTFNVTNFKVCQANNRTVNQCELNLTVNRQSEKTK